MIESESTQTQLTAMTLHLIDLWGQLSEEMKKWKKKEKTVRGEEN